MFVANLSFGLLGKYLDVVVGAGFVRVQNSKYELTELGREFLNDYRRFEERYLRAQKSLESLVCERERLTRSVKDQNYLSQLNLLQSWNSKVES
jgi:DNA-binding PadR family transcriptional regulator